MVVLAVAMFCVHGPEGWPVALFLTIGAALGFWYVARGARLPDWIVTIFNIAGLLDGGSEMTHDDDPRNLHPAWWIGAIVAGVLLGLVVTAVIIALS